MQIRTTEKPQRWDSPFGSQMKKEELLFEIFPGQIDIDLLNQGVIPKNLREVFSEKGRPLSELEYLLALPISCRPSLDKLKVNGEIRNRFEREGHLLSQSVSLEILSEDQWKLSDDIRHIHYLILDKPCAFEVYREPVNIEIKEESSEWHLFDREGKEKYYLRQKGENLEVWEHPSLNLVLKNPFFRHIDERSFPRQTSFHDILLNDARIMEYGRGDIIIREGDFGNSAFVILTGEAFVLPPEELDKLNLDKTDFGRADVGHKSFFETLFLPFKNNREPEVRDYLEDPKERTPSGRLPEVTRCKLKKFDTVIKDPFLAGEQSLWCKKGQLFGEIATLSRTPRTASVIAAPGGVNPEGDETHITRLLEIRWQGLRELMKYDKKIKEKIDSNYRKYGMMRQVSSCEIFQKLPEESSEEKDFKEAILEKVHRQTRLVTYGDFDWYNEYNQLRSSSEKVDTSTLMKSEPIIVEEDECVEHLILVRGGFVRVSKQRGKGHRTLSYLGRNNFYGLEEIVTTLARKKDSQFVPMYYQHSLRAVGYADILLIPSEIIYEILEKYPEEVLANHPHLLEILKGDKRGEKKGQTASNEINHEVLDFLLAHRFINGTKAMMIDLERCTRCDDCVHACASAHDNNPRFIRQGLRKGKYMIANACMHCADPVCMIGCPTGAIHRTSFGSQIVINDKTCIGCGNCAESCPYDNIRMVETRSDSGKLFLDKEFEKPIRKATKCDLCVDIKGGPACERACPHEALVRVDLTDLQKLGEWINK